MGDKPVSDIASLKAQLLNSGAQLCMLLSWGSTPSAAEHPKVPLRENEGATAASSRRPPLYPRPSHILGPSEDGGALVGARLQSAYKELRSCLDDLTDKDACCELAKALPHQVLLPKGLGQVWL